MTGINLSIFKQPKSSLLKKMLMFLVGVALMGVGIGLNSCIGLGTDPISVFSDGVHKFLNMSLGSAFTLTNCTIFLIVLLFGRRYINIGTLLHAIFLGTFVNMGVSIYSVLNIREIIFLKIIVASIACILLFFGTALLISVNIGLDVWTGLAMLLKDRTHKEYKIFRVVIDIFSLVIGYLMGGTVGVVTILAACFGGPIIQWFVKIIEKSILTKIGFK